MKWMRESMRARERWIKECDSQCATAKANRGKREIQTRAESNPDKDKWRDGGRRRSENMRGITCNKVFLHPRPHEPL